GTVAGILTFRDDAFEAKLAAQAKIVAPLTDGSNSKTFEVAPVARNLARVSIASRNLANNFADIGVTVSPQDLVKPTRMSGTRHRQQAVTDADVSWFEARPGDNTACGR